MTRATIPRFLSRAVALTVLLLLSACAMESPADELDPPPAGALRGQLVTYVFDFSDHSEVQHALRLPSGEERALRFASAPELASGTAIDVWGSDEGGALRVSRVEMVQARADGVVAERAALIMGTKKMPKHWAFVLVDTNGAGNLTKANADLKLFSDSATSIKSY